MALLTRISTDEVNQPYSLEAQAAGLEAFVASQPGMRITHRFVDQASGATLDGPGLEHALADARAGDFDVLLVYRIDPFCAPSSWNSTPTVPLQAQRRRSWPWPSASTKR